MEIRLPDLGANFKINAINKGNNYATTATANEFIISPGTYFITAASGNDKSRTYPPNVGEFIAPASSDSSVFVTHAPNNNVTVICHLPLPLRLLALIKNDKVSAEIRNSSGKWKTIR